jgi:hypothetical protein
MSGILIVGVASVNFGTMSPFSGVTYGASSLTRIGSFVGADSSAAVEFWSLFSPPTGTATVTVTLTGSNYFLAGGSSSYFNVGGTGAFAGTYCSGCDEDPPNPSNPLVTVNANSGDLVVDTVVLGKTSSFSLAAGSGQTERWNSGTIPIPLPPPFPPVTFYLVAGGSDKPASSPVTMSWNAGSFISFGPEDAGGWILAAVALTPARTLPVGGIVVPVDTLAVLAPWLVVMGLVGCISTAVVVAKKREM